MSEKEKDFLKVIFKEEIELIESGRSKTYTHYKVKNINGKKLEKRVLVDFYNDLIYCHDRDPNYLGKINVFYFEDRTDRYASKSYEKRYFKKHKIENSQSLIRILRDMGVYKKVVPEKICKKINLTVEVDNGFDSDDERELDQLLADTLSENGFALINSDNYEDIN